MEEIDLNQLFNYLKSKIVYIIFVMAVSFSVAALYVYFIRVPEYTSSTTILLNQTNAQATINTSDLTLNKSLVPTYSEIIKSKRVLNQVIESLALKYEYSELSRMISVSEVKDTSIIRISVTNEDNELSAKIANEIANVFTREIVDIYNLENISVIDQAEVSLVSSNTSIVKIVCIVTLAGGLLATAAIFVLFYFDTTVKNEEDIERATGLPVIGLIPMPHEKIKKSYHKKYYEEIAKKHKSDTVQEVLPVSIDNKVKNNTNNFENHDDIDEVLKEANYRNVGDIRAEDLVQKVLEEKERKNNQEQEIILNDVDNEPEVMIPIAKLSNKEKIEQLNNLNPADTMVVEKIVSSNAPRKHKKKKKQKIRVEQD